MEAQADEFADGKAIKFTNRDICPLCEGTERIPYKFFYKFGRRFHYWMCKCGMVYLNQMAKDQVEFYRLVYPEDSEERAARHANLRAKRIFNAIPSDWKISSHLDVGCGHIILMDKVGQEYGCVSEGVDYSPQDPEYKIYSHIDDVTKTYDLVTAIHVIEHEPNPVPFVQRIVEASSKYVLIEVPCIGHRRDEFVRHVNLFTPWTLERLLDHPSLEKISLEWQLVVIDKEYNSFVLQYLGRKI